MRSQGMIFHIVNIYAYLRYPFKILHFRRIVGHFPNVGLPLNYFDRMLWRKLFDRNPLFTQFCDKLGTKCYAQTILKEAKVPKTLWTGFRIDDEAKKVLREGGILKANHGCGMNIIIGEGNTIPSEIEEVTETWMQTTYGIREFEVAYFNVEKKLFIEEYLKDQDNNFIDINVRASNGKCLSVSCITGNKTPGQKVGYFNLSGKRITEFNKLTNPEYVLESTFEIPKCFLTCLKWTSQLSQGVDYARFDFMIANNMVYIGEITVYPSGGISSERTELQKKYHEELVQGWDLRQSYFLKTQNIGFFENYRLQLLKYCEEHLSNQYSSH